MNVEAEKAKQAAAEKAKKQYEDLKDLRTQQEGILKEKIRLVQNQVDSYTTMLNKLQSTADGESKRKMVGEIESKLVSLNAQLQSLNEQRDNPGTVVPAASLEASPGGREGGYNAYRRGGGRFHSSGRRGKGRVGRFISSRGRGAIRGRGGRGRDGGGGGIGGSVVIPPPVAESGGGDEFVVE